MKILVTGGSGFIGAFLVRELSKRGDDVFILSNHARRNDSNFIYADVVDREKILEVVPQFDVVYHLAGLLGTSELIEKAYRASEVNILGTINILDGALVNKTKVVYITKPNCWLNTYSITKHTGEAFAKMYFKELGLPTVCLRWFNVFGPNQSFHCQKAVPYFIRWALNDKPIEVWGNGEQTVDLIYVTDAVRATVLVGENGSLGGKTVDIGTGEETSVNQLARLIIELSGSSSKIKHLPMRSGETPNTRLKADTSVLKKMDFSCSVGLKEGLKRTIEAYRLELLQER